MKYPYSMGSAVGYSIVLLISLWWLPVLGPMIIGYITGRKAGGPVKGAIAMIVPIGLYFFIVYFTSIGWIHMPHIVSRYFTGYFSATVAGSSILPYLQETMNAGMAVGRHIQSYLYYTPTVFFIMLAFAFIGGAISKQVIMERGIYPDARVKLTRRKRIDIPTHEVNKFKKPVQNSIPKEKNSPVHRDKIENLSRNSRFVVHPMDTKKVVPSKPKKKYGITFL